MEHGGRPGSRDIGSRPGHQLVGSAVFKLDGQSTEKKPPEAVSAILAHPENASSGRRPRPHERPPNPNHIPYNGSSVDSTTPAKEEA